MTNLFKGYAVGKLKVYHQQKNECMTANKRKT